MGPRPKELHSPADRPPERNAQHGGRERMSELMCDGGWHHQQIGQEP